MSQAPILVPDVPSDPLDLRARTRLHVGILLGATLVLIAAAVLEIPDPENVSFLGVPLPGTCTLRRFTGYPCAGCGLTRSFVSLAHGQFADAWRFHPLGIVLFLVFALQIPYRAGQLRRIHRGQPEWELRGMNWFWWPLFVLFLAHWLWRLAF